MNALTKNKFLTDEELQHLLKLCNRNLNTRDSILIRFALFTGARGCEVLAVTKADFSNGFVTIRGAKGSSDRTVPLPEDFNVEVTAFASSLKDTDRLFPIAVRSFRHIWHQWRPCKKGLHCLRHTYGVRLYNNCEDIHSVKTALGHKNIQNTMVYLNFVESQKRLKTATTGMWSKDLDCVI